ncbi:MAG: type II secretion system F family protein [Anaerolineales bacterium]
MTSLLPLMVSLFAGLSMAILMYTLFRAASLRRSVGLEAADQPSIYVRVAPILDLVPVPISIQQAWADQSPEGRMQQAGLVWTERQYVAFRWLLFWLLSIIGLLLTIAREWDLLGVFLSIVLVLGGLLYPEIWMRRRIESRRLEIDLALPDFLDRLALGLEAGLGFEIALRRTARNFPGLLGEELRYVVRQLDRGHTRSSVLERMLARVPSTDLGAFVAAVKQTDRLGTSLARTLQVQKVLMRARRRRRAEEASRRLPILIVFPLVFFFLPALLIIYLAPPLLHLFLGQ